MLTFHSDIITIRVQFHFQSALLTAFFALPPQIHYSSKFTTTASKPLKMRFFSITTIVSVAALAIATPISEPEPATANLAIRNYSPPSSTQCSADGGTLSCCSAVESSANNPASTNVASLLGIPIQDVLPYIGIACTLPILSELICLPGQSNVCCQNVSPQGLVNIDCNAIAV